MKEEGKFPKKRFYNKMQGDKSSTSKNVNDDNLSHKDNVISLINCENLTPIDFNIHSLPLQIKKDKIPSYIDNNFRIKGCKTIKFDRRRLDVIPSDIVILSPNIKEARIEKVIRKGGSDVESYKIFSQEKNLPLIMVFYDENGKVIRDYRTQNIDIVLTANSENNYISTDIDFENLNDIEKKEIENKILQVENERKLFDNSVFSLPTTMVVNKKERKLQCPRYILKYMKRMNRNLPVEEQLTKCVAREFFPNRITPEFEKLPLDEKMKKSIDLALTAGYSPVVIDFDNVKPLNKKIKIVNIEFGGIAGYKLLKKDDDDDKKPDINENEYNELLPKFNEGKRVSCPDELKDEANNDGMVCIAKVLKPPETSETYYRKLYKGIPVETRVLASIERGEKNGFSPVVKDAFNTDIMEKYEVLSKKVGYVLGYKFVHNWKQNRKKIDSIDSIDSNKKERKIIGLIKEKGKSINTKDIFTKSINDIDINEDKIKKNIEKKKKKTIKLDAKEGASDFLLNLSKDDDDFL